MTIRRKVPLILAVTLFSLIGAILASSYLLLTGSFVRLEEREVRLNLERAKNAITDDLAGLRRSAEDYAAWDPTYDFMGTRSADYLDKNFMNATLYGLHVSFIGIFGSDGKAVFVKSIDEESGGEVKVPVALLDYLDDPDGLLRRPGRDQPLGGLLLLPNHPVLIAMCPILTTERKGPRRGTLIMGRYLDANEVAHLAQAIRLTLLLERLDMPQSSRDAKIKRTLLLANQESVVVPSSSGTISGFTLIRDVGGKPALLAEVTMSRAIYEQGQTTLLYFLFSLMLIFVPIPILSIQSLPIRRRYRHHAIALAEIHQMYTLRSASGNPNGTHIGTNHNAPCGDNHQVIILLGDHSRCCHRPGLLRDLRGNYAAATSALRRIFINRRPFTVPILRNYQQFASLGCEVK